MTNEQINQTINQSINTLTWHCRWSRSNAAVHTTHWVTNAHKDRHISIGSEPTEQTKALIWTPGDQQLLIITRYQSRQLIYALNECCFIKSSNWGLYPPDLMRSNRLAENCVSWASELLRVTVHSPHDTSELLTGSCYSCVGWLLLHLI